jgi:putative ABC transport system permease protein
MEEHPEVSLQYRFSSLNDLYLTAAGKGGSRRLNTTLSLLAIGLLTLLIAFVNFVNLALAMAPSRVKNITIRKILGANKTALRLAIASESVLFTVIAAGMAFAGIHFLQGSTFARELFPTIAFSLWSYAGLFAVATGVILLLAFAIGLYTMRYATSFDEIEALKGSFALGVKGVKMRNLLIVIQFTSAIALICISIFIRQQNEYMRHFDWGVPRTNVLYVQLAGLGKEVAPFGQELLRDPRIVDYCILSSLPGRVGMSWGRQFEGKHVSLVVWSVDDRFFDFFEIPILAGRKPEHMDSLVSQIVVNETFLKEYGFDETIVGKDITAFGPGCVQAIARDVNFQSLHQPITPMAFAVLSQRQYFQFMMIKLAGHDIQGAIRQIKQTWNTFSSEPYNVWFLDESMDQLYQKETNMAKLIALFGFIIVVIAVMGIYGLISFNAKYREKEIAIRKVNGSSTVEIMLLLNRAILIQLGIAFAIAVPIAWYATTQWLENFAYRISVHWWVFLLSGLIVLLVTLLTVSIRSYRSATANPIKALNK